MMFDDSPQTNLARKLFPMALNCGVGCVALGSLMPQMFFAIYVGPKKVDEAHIHFMYVYGDHGFQSLFQMNLHYCGSYGGFVLGALATFQRGCYVSTAGLYFGLIMLISTTALFLSVYAGETARREYEKVPRLAYRRAAVRFLTYGICQYALCLLLYGIFMQMALTIGHMGYVVRSANVFPFRFGFIFNWLGVMFLLPSWYLARNLKSDNENLAECEAECDLVAREAELADYATDGCVRAQPQDATWQQRAYYDASCAPPQHAGQSAFMTQPAYQQPSAYGGWPAPQAMAPLGFS